jgi:hypothetical protein
MSKKLIAVASAAALALTALVGVAPASATVTLTVSGTDSGAGTSASPYLESVPVANILDAATSIAVAATTTVGDVMTVTATGGVRILDVVTGTDADKLYTAASGTQSYTATATTTSTSFIVYNTSTTAGTIQVSLKSATASATGAPVYVQGVVGTSYNFNVVAPTTTTTNTASEVLITVTDQFGNALENVAAASTLIAGADSVAGLGTLPTLGAATWDATRKVYVASLSAVTTPTEFAYILTVASGDVADVGGLAKANRGGFFQINSAATATANAAATAQIAALTAQLAASRPKATSVTKKKYNTLARKWNAAFPSQKVALKK